MKTILCYLNNPFLFEHNAIFLKQEVDEVGSYIILDSTLFYPQGGGQPSDQGFMTTSNGDIVSIHHVKSINNEVRHYTQHPVSLIQGQEIHCHINIEIRLKHSQLHSAGHLLSNLVEKIYPEWKAIKGHHFPGEAYVEFISSTSRTEIDLNTLNNELNQAIEASPTVESLFIAGEQLSKYCPDLPFSIPEGEKIRLIRIGNYPFQPCGGTHLDNLSNIKSIILTKYKIKKGHLKISYGIN